jgi:hypothetical protein
MSRSGSSSGRYRPTDARCQTARMVDERPIDGTRWGAWNGGAFERWQVVARSWAVFVRNTDELVGLLNLPATNMLMSLELMNDDHATAASFWDELDQRLHNQLSSAATLVDHTRRLTDYYAADFPQLAQEFETRNKAVIAMDEAAFLRRLRNYLCGRW